MIRPSIKKKLKDKLIHIDIQSQIGNITIYINYIRFVEPSNIPFKHYHNCFEFHYLLDGQELLLVDDKSYSLEVGNIYYISPKVIHSRYIDFSENEKYFKVIINFDLREAQHPSNTIFPFANQEMQALIEQFNEKKYWVGKDTEGCIDIIYNIFHELHTEKIGYYTIIQNAIANLIVLTIRAMSDSVKVNYQVPININDNHCVRILNFIAANYQKNITVNDALGSIFFSTRHINRLLKDHYGLTFHQLLTNYRIEIVKKFLSHSDLSLERIAEKVGFNSPYYLSKIFKNNEGITISNFKKDSNRKKHLHPV